MLSRSGATYVIPWSELFANDTDPDMPRSNWTVAQVSNVVGGTVRSEPVTQTIHFTPFAGGGTQAFDYTLSAGDGGRDTARVTINSTSTPPVVLPPVVNAAGPTAVNDIVTSSGGTIVIPWSQLFANDSDPSMPRTNWTVAQVGGVLGGSAVNQPVTQTIQFVPAAGQSPHSFVYTLNAGDGQRDTAHVTIVTSTPATATGFGASAANQSQPAPPSEPLRDFHND